MKPKTQTGVVALLSAVLAATIFALDLLTPLGVAESVLYMGVVLVAFRANDRRLPALTAGACTALIVLGFVYSPAGGEQWVGAVNRLLAIAGLWVITFAWQRHARAQDILHNVQAELERQVAERTANLTAANLRLEREMTEHQNVEAALRESEKRFRQLAENIKEVFYIRDIEQGRMLYVSPAYEEIWGRPLRAIYENPADFISLVHPDDRDRVIAAREAQFAGKPFNAEYRIVRDDGGIRWIWARTFPVRDKTGRVYRIAGIAEDITERKRLEEERFALAQQQRDTLVREVHHRIKNNLQGVVGLLRQHVAQFPQTRPLLENAIAQVQSVAIVHGLQSNQPDRRIRLCDMTNAIAHAMENLTRARIEPEVDVEISVARPIEVAEEEAVPVALILNELMFNAVKHGRQDAAHPVRVLLRSDNGTACVCILSTGSSLPAGFDFAAGTGLGTGLSLLKSLLPHQGARLSFESDVDADTVTAKLVLAPPVIRPQDPETGG